MWPSKVESYLKYPEEYFAQEDFAYCFYEFSLCKWQKEIGLNWGSVANDK